MAAMLNSRRKLYQRISYLCGKNAFFHHACFTCREERQTVIQCICLNLLNTGCTNTATRRVNNTQRGHVIIWIDDNLKVRHDISDFCAIKESSAANNLVRNTSSKQHIFENTRLGVGAIEHGYVVVRCTLIVQFFYLGANPRTLITLIRCLIHLDFLAVSLIGKKTLWLAVRVVRNNCIGSGQNMAR